MNTYATPGEIIDVWSSHSDGEMKSTVLRTAHMEVMRLHVADGAQVPTYEAQGEITVLCVEGRIVVETSDLKADLVAGQMLYLLTNVPFVIFGVIESSLLITILRPVLREGNQVIGT